MGWDFASLGNCRTLMKLKREMLVIIRVECQDDKVREFYTDQLNILIDSLHDFINNDEVPMS